MSRRSAGSIFPLFLFRHGPEAPCHGRGFGLGALLRDTRATNGLLAGECSRMMVAMETSLNAELTVSTIETLRNRIDERFPKSGLGTVCGTLLDIAYQSKVRAEQIARPRVRLRIVSAILIILGVVVAGYSVLMLDLSWGRFNAGEFVQIIESSIHTIILVGAAGFFLVTIEIRIKRARVIEALHELQGSRARD